MKRFFMLGTCLVALTGLALTGCAKQQKKTTTGMKRIHFDFDKSDIKASAEPALRNNAKWLQENSSKNITIAGHCDERGSFEYNIALGDRRANSAKNYLKNLGIASNRLRTVSYGEEQAVATCSNESCWWQNRRAEFIAK